MLRITFTTWLSACILLTGLQSCMLPGKVDKVVSMHFAQSGGLKQIEPTNPDLYVNTDSLQRINGYCKSELKRFFTVPLFVYNYWGEKIRCTINPRIYARHVVLELEQMMKSAETDSAFKNKTIELHFTRMPSTFYHNYNFHAVYLLYTTVNFQKSECYNFPNAEKTDKIAVTYTIRDKQDQRILKSGKFIQWCEVTYLQKQPFERKKQFLEMYVQNYDARMKEAGTNLAREIVYELKNPIE